jgi:hypothetical protein
MAGSDDENPTVARRARQPVLDLNTFGAPRAHPPTPAPYPAQPPSRGPHFDMDHMAARDAAVRRAIWIIVLVLAAAIGIGVASQL